MFIIFIFDIRDVFKDFFSSLLFFSFAFVLGEKRVRNDAFKWLRILVSNQLLLLLIRLLYNPPMNLTNLSEGQLFGDIEIGQYFSLLAFYLFEMPRLFLFLRVGEVEVFELLI
jgi:hypothetical protein